MSLFHSHLMRLQNLLLTLEAKQNPPDLSRPKILYRKSWPWPPKMGQPSSALCRQPSTVAIARTFEKWEPRKRYLQVQISGPRTRISLQLLPSLCFRARTVGLFDFRRAGFLRTVLCDAAVISWQPSGSDNQAKQRRWPRLSHVMHFPAAPASLDYPSTSHQETLVVLSSLPQMKQEATPGALPRSGPCSCSKLPTAAASWGYVPGSGRDGRALRADCSQGLLLPSGCFPFLTADDTKPPAVAAEIASNRDCCNTFSLLVDQTHRTWWLQHLWPSYALCSNDRKGLLFGQKSQEGSH